VDMDEEGEGWEVGNSLTWGGRTSRDRDVVFLSITNKFFGQDVLEGGERYCEACRTT